MEEHAGCSHEREAELFHLLFEKERRPADRAVKRARALERRLAKVQARDRAA